MPLMPVILSTWPDAKCTVNEDAGTITEWHHPTLPQPSDAELAAAVASYKDVPASVTRAQGKIQLARAGLLSQVEAIVNASSAETQIWFEDAAIWERNNAHVLALAAALSPPLTSDQIDALFIASAAIV